MPAFVNPALLWGLGLLAAPILIHLINLWRRRPVQWAAMEFLLESQKKNRRWVVLRQLLLLLARLAAIAALVMVLAQPLLGNRFGSLLGGARTHHVILLDDSFSMSDRWGDTSAFARGKQAIERIVQRAGRLGGGQMATLLRFSQAGGDKTPARPDMLAARLTTTAGADVERLLLKLDPSQTAAGPLAAIEAAGKLLDETSGDNVVLYIVSDFRANEWQAPQALREELSRWRNRQAQVRLVACVDEQHANLAVTSLKPQRGLLAAGVPFFVEVAVKNFGAERIAGVPVLLREDGHARPAVVIDGIAPGATETQRFLVNFPTAAEHVVTASTEVDSVAADNSRSAVIDVPVGVPVLVVDGDAAGADGKFLALALSPGGGIRTGIDVQVEGPRYLVDHPLARFRSIYLTNAANLDESAVTALENYARSGGGLAVFLGEASDSRFVNDRLYRDGQGLFPIPVTSPTQLFVDQLNRRPDLEVTDHPIFKVFLGERNSFLSAVTVERYFTVPKNAEQQAGAASKVIARLRNGAPLAVERKFGQGRVVAFLTTAAPAWNNWGRNPSFVVAMLELQSYLSAHDEPAPGHTVGQPLVVEFDPARYQPRATFVVPGDEASIEHPVDAVREENRLAATFADASRAGVYEVKLSTLDGRVESRRYVVDVSPDEGDLAWRSGQELATALGSVKFVYDRADALAWESPELAGFNLSDGFLCALIAILIGEQLLAYGASFHPSTKRGGRS